VHEKSILLVLLILHGQLTSSASAGPTVRLNSGTSLEGFSPELPSQQQPLLTAALQHQYTQPLLGHPQQLYHPPRPRVIRQITPQQQSVLLQQPLQQQQSVLFQQPLQQQQQQQSV
ncbi:unnamed protein product, partial [Meganyctiphanes norvegica]